LRVFVATIETQNRDREKYIEHTNRYRHRKIDRKTQRKTKYKQRNNKKEESNKKNRNIYIQNTE